MEKGKIFLLPPLIGGAITVLATTIPPFSLLNLFFFFWFFAGGAITYYIVVKNNSYIEQKYDGAIYGFFSGIFAWFFHSIFIFFLYLNGKFETQSIIEKIREFPLNNKDELILMLQETGIEKIIIAGSLIIGIFYISFGTIGGIIGKKIFNKGRE